MNHDSEAPLVSVILPTYNRASLLGRAIASVLGQSYRTFELIVVDDGSQDETEQVVRSFQDSRIVYLPPERNLGDAGARNRGIARASGSWLAFQDSDDEWLPEKLELQLAIAHTLPTDFGAVGSAVIRFVGGPIDILNWPAPASSSRWSEVDRSALIAGFSAYLQSLVVKREAFDVVGPFDNLIKSRSDFEFCLRLAASFRIAATTEPTVISYETADSLSAQIDYARHDIRYIFDKHKMLIETSRKTAARYWYLLAKSEFIGGANNVGYAALCQSLRRNPTAALSWALLLASTFGGNAVARLARWAKWVRRGVNA